jgi:hypothetical protein
MTETGPMILLFVGLLCIGISLIYDRHRLLRGESMSAPPNPPAPDADPRPVPTKSEPYDPPLDRPADPLPTGDAPSGGVKFSAAPPIPKVPSPWLDNEPLADPAKAGVSFAGATIQRRSKLLNRPPTPPKPSHSPGQLSPVNSISTGLTGRVTFGPVPSEDTEERRSDALDAE